MNDGFQAFPENFATEVELQIQSVWNGFMVKVGHPTSHRMHKYVIQSTGHKQEDLQALTDLICSIYSKEG